MSRVTQVRTRASSGANARPAPSPGNLLQRHCNTCGTHLLAGAPCTNCHGSKVQAKLKIGGVEDPCEREADKAADAVTNGRDVPTLSPAPGAPQRRAHEHDTHAGHVAPDSVESIAQLPGQPLEPTVRDSMERRFHYDFGPVRVHTDANAASAAESIGARAFTSGQHIAFGHGQYAPNGNSGLHLLAHELAHVVQQQRETVRRSPTPKAPTAKPKFYQEVLDKIAEFNQTNAQQGFPLYSSELDILQKLQALCEAVDAGRVADVPGLLKIYLDADSDTRPLSAPSSTLVLNLAVEMMKLGLDRESQRIRDHYDSMETAAYGAFGGQKTRRLEYLERTAATLLSGVKTGTPQEVSASIDQLFRVFTPLTAALIAVHIKGFMPQSTEVGLFPKPGIDPTKYEIGLIDLTTKVFARLQMLLQQQMDAAVAETAAGRGTALLKTLDANVHKLAPLIHDGAGDTISDLPFDLTHTVMTSKSAGRLEDSMSTGSAATARSAAITTFDQSRPFDQELKGNLGYLYEARRTQVDMIIRLYGATSLIDADAQKRGLNAQDASSNAATIQATGKSFDLHSNDDWRAFALAKYKQSTGGPSANAQSKEAALQSVITLLFDYLKVFTLHPVYSNLYDAGAEQDNYLTKKFPRAMSGQLLHDCGVYAVRVAYILATLRNELGLRFHFVTVPQHIVLIIEGDNVPTYVVSNDQFLQQKRSGALTPQAMGELAAGIYLNDPPDTPFIETNVTSSVDNKSKLWGTYQTTAAKPLLSSDAAGKALELRYHQASDTQTRFQNRELTRFWNSSAPQWQRFIAAFTQAAGASGSLTGATLKPLVDSYLSSLNADAGYYDQGLSARTDTATQISDELAKNPQRVAPGAKIASGSNASIGSLAEIRLRQFRGRLGTFINQLAARPTATVTLNDVRAQLAPPFVGADDKAIGMDQLKDTP